MNIIEVLRSQLDNDTVNQLADRVDENPQTTRSAMEGIFPVILGGLLSKVNSEGEASSIVNFLRSTEADSSLTSNPGSLLGSGPNAERLADTGSGFLSAIFGDKLSGIFSYISSAFGLKNSSASTLMSLAAPLVMSVLGRQLSTADGGFSASGLMNFLSGQAGNIMAAAPAGLAGALGLSGFSGLMGTTGERVTGPTVPVGSATAGPTTTPSYSEPRRDVNYEPERPAGGLPKWLMPLLLALLGAALLWYLLRGCDDRRTDGNETGAVDTTVTTDMEAMGDTVATATGDAVDDAATAVGEAASDAATAVGGAAASLGEFGKRMLPNRIELNIPANGVENKLIAFIEDKSRAVDKETWFSFDRLEFDTGKATLKPSSQEQLKNIAEILKAYPGVNIKLGGYTDNTGNADANKRLSQARAETTMNELVRMGIAASRLEAEGYGQDHPVADNATAEGRQRNRRIDIRVTKK